MMGIIRSLFYGVKTVAEISTESHRVREEGYFAKAGEHHFGVSEGAIWMEAYMLSLGRAGKVWEWAKEGCRKSHCRHRIAHSPVPRHMVSLVHTWAGKQIQCHWNITLQTRRDCTAGHHRKPPIYSVGPQVSLVNLGAGYKMNSSSG